MAKGRILWDSVPRMREEISAMGYERHRKENMGAATLSSYQITATLSEFAGVTARIWDLLQVQDHDLQLIKVKISSLFRLLSLTSYNSIV